MPVNKAKVNEEVKELTAKVNELMTKLTNTEAERNALAKKLDELKKIDIVPAEPVKVTKVEKTGSVIEDY